MPLVNVDPKRREEINKLLLTAGATGLLKGALIGLVSGWYFSYRYNHGVNKRFFLTPYKFLYLVSWGIVGISFSTETAKMNIARHIAEEEQLNRALYFLQQLGGGK